MSWRSKPDLPEPEDAPPPSVDDDELAKRLAELTHREVALRKITEVVEKERTNLEQRERALARSASSAAAATEKRLAEATRRAEQAEVRVHALELQVTELEQNIADLEARPEPPRQEVAAAPPQPTPELPLPAPPERTVDPDGTESTYTLQRLERLVHEAQLRGDPQADEWAYYLPLLREHAEPDGRLPAQFAALVDSVFAA
jgi:DNA-binding transcriptional MerR regulator